MALTALLSLSVVDFQVLMFLSSPILTLTSHLSVFLLSPGRALPPRKAAPKSQALLMDPF